MRALHAAILTIGLATAGLIVGGFHSSGDLGGKAVGASTSPSSQTAAQDESPSATTYLAELKPIGESGVSGRVRVLVKGDRLAVTVNAKGFPKQKGQRHPQHIHANASCEDFGGVFLPLDDNLSGSGGKFPTATPGGTINYQQRDAKSEIVNNFGALNLADRTVVVHKSNGTPAACGALNPVGK